MPKKFQIVTNWNMIDYLPDVLKEPFEVFVGEFVFKPMKWRVQFVKEYMNSISTSQDQDFAGSHTLEQQVEVAEKEYLQRLVLEYFMPKLFALVPKIQRQYMSEEFPVGPGSHLTMTNPALEFIKSLTHVFGLDKQTTEQTLLMRRNLLRMIQVREFESNSKWADPCRSYTLQDVICSYCNYCQDLDLCRDPALVYNSPDAWLCPQCRQPYDELGIEHRLVQIAQGSSNSIPVPGSAVPADKPGANAQHDAVLPRFLEKVRVRHHP